MKTVSPALTPSRRRPRSAVSPTTAAPAATLQSSDAGLLAHVVSTAYSAAVWLP